MEKLRKAKTVLFVFFFVFFLGAAFYIATGSRIEAFPEFTNVQVQVITPFPGKASEEVERQLTLPLEAATSGIPGLINQRSVSIFGLSVITLTFDDQVESRQARLDVAQRLGDANLPDGIKPGLSPDSTPVGEIYRYTLDGSLPPGELRLTEDFQLEREFKSIPGVADVVSFGGPTRSLDVVIDPAKLRAQNLNLNSVAQSVGQNHANAGGAMITRGESGLVVRSLGLYESPEDIETAVVATERGVPIRVADLGRAELGSKPRLGQVGRNEVDDAVEGLILIRAGGDSRAVCEAIDQKIKALNENGLPKGMRINPYYKRTELIDRSSHTVFHNIFFGITLVCLLLLIGLGYRYWAISLAVALIIPFSLLMVFVVLKFLGQAPNLISLGAVDFGIIVESAIFAGEAMIFAHLQGLPQPGIRKAFFKVMIQALVCAAVLMIAFIPILSLQRVEGKIFRPLGITLVAALFGGQLGSFIFMPLALFALPKSVPAPNRVDQGFAQILSACLKLARKLRDVRNFNWILGVSLSSVSLILWLSMGREFLPQLNEGSLYIRATAPQSISLETASDLAAKIRSKLKTIPEVIDVVSHLGRPDDGTDVNGFDNTEYFVTLVPQSEWKSASNMAEFNALAAKKLEDIPGVDFNYSQPIKDNVDEAISGVKGELVLKIFGPNLNELQKRGDQAKDLVANIPGAEDVGTEQLLGQPELRFQINKNLLARFGLRVADAEEALETALMGKTAGRLIDDQGRSIDIQVKPDLKGPPSVENLSALTLVNSEGGRIPLNEISEPKLVEGVSRIYREGGLRRIAVKCSVRGRPVVDFVKQAADLLNDKMKLPPGYRMQWSGSFENASRASQQLLIVVPLCLVTILVLLFTWFGEMRIVAFLLWEIPFAVVGGLASLKLFGLNFSISAAAGLIVLIGVSFLTGMMLISEWIQQKSAEHALLEKGRSMILSSGVAIIGLIPACFSHGMGSETAKPFAVIIFGGLISSLIFSLIALPAVLTQSSSKSELAHTG